MPKLRHDNRNHAGHAGERMVIMSISSQSEFNVFEVPGNAQARVQTPMFAGHQRACQTISAFNAHSRETFEHVRGRLETWLGASDRTITDFGSSSSVSSSNQDRLGGGGALEQRHRGAD